MSWKLTIFDDYLHTGESCLKLTHSDRINTFRSWFGPMAHQLFNVAVDKYHRACRHQTQSQLSIQKQFAQHLLIEASFHHQRCLQRYQIYTDIKNSGLNHTQNLSEILLFIRMTPQHPCIDTLQLFANKQLPNCLDLEEALQSLTDVKLIQKICVKEIDFYDKNPYPHDHVWDFETKDLKDYTLKEHLKSHQQLIKCHL